MDDLKSVIAKNIAALRRQQGYTQIELAERLNYSDKAVSKWERGDSVPDVLVLKELADLFGVTLDYLVEAEHPSGRPAGLQPAGRTRNRAFITGISVLLVWLLATFAFVTCDIVGLEQKDHWLAFVCAVPVSMIVWLVFNSIWFNPRRNFLIISLLMWSVLGALYLILLPFGFNIWQIFVLGIPGQVIIVMWSRLRRRTRHD